MTLFLYLVNRISWPIEKDYKLINRFVLFVLKWLLLISQVVAEMSSV